MHCKSELIVKEKQHHDCAYMLVPSDATQVMPHESENAHQSISSQFTSQLLRFLHWSSHHKKQEYICGDWGMILFDSYYDVINR